MDGSDLRGRWMAHHLAALVTAAESDATIEQRQGIVELVLRIWTHRQYLPSPPLGDFESVLQGLARLGDPSPWAFARIGLSIHEDDHVRPLFALAIDLEAMLRKTMVRLAWLETRSAADHEEAWLKIGSEASELLELEVYSTLDRLRRQDRMINPDGVDTRADDALGHSAQARDLRSMAERLRSLADALDAAGEQPPTD